MDWDLIIVVLIILAAFILGVALKVIIAIFAKKGIDKISHKEQ